MSNIITEVFSTGPGKYLSLLAFISTVICSSNIKAASIDVTYNKGVDAYSGERWSECIAQFEESLHLYNLYKTITGNCRLTCNSQQYESNIKENIEDLKFYEKLFNTRDCLNKCQEKGFEHVNLKSDIDDSTLHYMQARKPYEYLHVCYFQMNALHKSASAVYTYLIANPEDQTMKNNLKYYVNQPEVDAKEITDLLSDDYMVMYKLGLKAYNQNNWRETIASMEEVLTDYISWENNCRVECERQPEQEWSPEFVKTISNAAASLLHCRQHCQDDLKSLEYASGVDFLAEILNYLQISYYHLDRFNDAAKAVTSYLEMIPNDETMLENKKIYSTLIDKDAFVGRSDIEYYFKRDRYEKQLLKLFHQGNDNNEINSNAL